ncbi:MAG: ribulose-phosphate 3-epimerase [Bacteroidales bacterium]|nr:ribulose-phosphate 3-epimerase [Bacteroidales bacterium]
MTRLIAPSLLAADFTCLQKDVEMVNASEADWFHMDIMDGVFVPNISFGIPVVQAVKRIAAKPLDVHLMIVEPEKYLHKFRDAGADILTVHIEACRHLHRTIQEIKELGMKAGVTLNPHTPAESLKEIISFVDMVLVMSVNPGFGGQKFIPTSYEKIRKTRSMIEESGSRALIEVDGGVDLSNAAALFEAGVDILVTGTTVFKAEDPAGMIHQLKTAGLGKITVNSEK